MIQLENIEKTYQTRTLETLALRDINLKIDAGEFVSIMGPSGSGKSTLLNVIGLLDRPTQGTIRIDQQTIENYGDRTLARLRNQTIGFIFQSFHLVNDLNVLDNVELPLIYRSGASRKARRQKAEEALDRVGLSARLKHFPSQLSGGQRQRVAIARALVGAPKILLADEPTGNLDSKTGEDIMTLLHQLNQKEQTTIVMVTHDEQLAKTTNRTIRIFDGGQVQ